MQMVQMPDGKLQIFSQPNAPQQQQPQPPLPQQYSKNTNSGHRSRNVKSKVEIVPATGEPMDEEWDGASYAERSIANKNKRKRVEQSAISERIGKP